MVVACVDGHRSDRDNSGPRGGVPEWSNGLDSKSSVGSSLPWVRIPPPPPFPLFMGNRNNMLLYRAFISPQTNPQASLTFPEIVALRASETASWGCSQPAPLFPIHSLPASRHPESRYGSHPGGGRGGANFHFLIAVMRPSLTLPKNPKGTHPALFGVRAYPSAQRKKENLPVSECLLSARSRRSSSLRRERSDCYDK